MPDVLTDERENTFDERVDEVACLRGLHVQIE